MQLKQRFYKPWKLFRNQLRFTSTAAFKLKQIFIFMQFKKNKKFLTKYNNSRSGSAAISQAGTSHELTHTCIDIHTHMHIWREKKKKSVSVIPSAFTWNPDRTSSLSIHFGKGSTLLPKPFRGPPWKWGWRPKKYGYEIKEEAKKETRVKTGQEAGGTQNQFMGLLQPVCFSTCLMVNSQISVLFEPCFVLQWVKKEEDFWSHAG